MKRSQFFALFAGLIFLAQSAVTATADEFAGLEGEVKAMMDDFVEQRFAARTEKALNALITVAASALRERGHELEAEEMLTQWSVLSLSGIGLFDLGDHDPLNQWLATTYAKLESKLGPKVMAFFRLDDIKIFNYAIPVVFSPRKWDMNEYRLHFVPFSAATSYWISRVTCSIVTTGLVSWFCGTIAEVPRFAVKKWIAPGLSDKVHSIANGNSTPKQQDILLGLPQELELRELFEKAREELPLSQEMAASGWL